jgi:hypothetical protein
VRGIAILMAWLAGTTSAAALDLSGEWQFERPARNGRHAGTIVIELNGQVRLSAQGPIQRYAQCGYLKQAGEQVEIVFTSVKSTYGYAADHFYCGMRAGALRCFNDDGQGKEPQLFTIERIGGIPAAPERRLEDACPVRQGPTSRARPAADFA